MSDGRIADRVPLLGGILPYDRRSLAPDILAGATLAAVAIPEGLGYAKIAGMPAQTGLYTCLLPVLAFALFASSRRLVIGADSATAAISAGAVGIVAAGDAGAFVALTGMLAILSGVVLVGAAWLRLGFLSDFLSRSVLAGFLTGVGIQIAIGQLDGMLGVDNGGGTTFEKLVGTIEALPDTKVGDLALAVGVVLLILGLGRFAPRLPGPLIAVVASMALAWALPLESEHGVEMVGALPAGLPALDWPGVSLSDVVALAPTALLLLVVQVGQSVSTAGAFATAHGDRHDPNRDLLGLGAANIAAGVGSSFVVNGSPTKTGISDQAGTRSQVAMVVLAVLTVPVLLFLTEVFAYLPEATLSAVVFVIALHLMKFGVLRTLARLPGRGEFWVAVSTTVIVAFVGVGAGIVWAVVASLAVHVRHTYRPRNTVLTLDADRGRVEQDLAPGLQTRPGVIVYRFAATLYFANAGRLAEDVSMLVRSAPTPVRTFVFDGSEVHRVDWTSAETLKTVIRGVQDAGARFVFARVPTDARLALDAYGVSEVVGPDGYVDTVRHALRDSA